MLSSIQAAKLIDHAILKPDATRKDVEEGIKTAVEYGAKSVCVRSCDVAFASGLLKGSDVECGCVVGFPHGNCSTEAKCAEAEQAILDGAQEVDMVLAIGLLKSGEYAFVKNDIKSVFDVCRTRGVLLKVIFETCYLTDEEKIKACEICSEVGVDYVKTSTGFGSGGAVVEDVKLMRAHCPEGVRVKASGGIRTLEDVEKFYNAGAERIGASATKAIVEEARKRENN